MSRERPFDHISARILELYIELNDYAYFHGPSEVDHIDRRFRGRHEILERLKSLLTRHESPSGAYLVTGYRGAGKSSLVAKALAEIIPTRPWALSSRRELRILAPVLASTLLKIPTGFLLLPFLPFGLILCWLAWADPRRPNFWSPRRPGWWKEAAKAVGRALIPEPENPPSSRRRAFWQDGLIICLLIACSAFVSREIFIFRFLVTLLGYLIYIRMLPPLVRAAADFWNQQISFSEWLVQKGKQVAGLRPLRRRIHLQINLSQDNLQEIDILRAISSNLEGQYRRFTRPNITRWLLRALMLLPFIALALAAYPYLQPWEQDIKADLHIACYFPSQGHFHFGDSEEGESIYLEALQRHFDSSEERGTEAFYEALHQRLEEKLGERTETFGHYSGSGWSGVLHRHIRFFTTNVDNLIQILWIKSREAVLPLLEMFPRYRGGETEVPHSSLGHFRALPQAAWAEIREALLPLLGLLLPEGRGGKSLLPGTLDYFLVLLIVLAWVLPQVVLRRFLFSRGHKSIHGQIRELNEMIAAEVTQEKGGVPIQPNTLLSFSFGQRRRQRFKVLDEREIEKRLIDILRLSTRVSPLDIRPELIVVFDELDKIQHRMPGANLASVDSANFEAKERQETELGIADVERKRQHRILTLVSNLKHFLSTAPAKFIFIAGREMFDAALADISDRQFFMGSVFNEILHVPSFHSDDSDGRLPDITSLPEQYLCRFLIPRRWTCREWNLAEYLKYLEVELLPDPAPRRDSQGEIVDRESWEKLVGLRQRQRDKVIYELHNFVTYLTYRSNGAPKRLTSTLERFIMPLPEVDRHPDPGERDPRHFLVGRSRRSLYLRFRYEDQYAFGLVTYMASPLIFSVNRAIKDYGDKILVSSAFVLDHIFKFHGHGFSWRNLELLPEVVDFNRAPQLRELITHIMRFMARGHVNEIISGLYHFKFTRRITEEIGILSKLSEHESAAFNFTLDESLALKQHFDRQLRKLLGTYQHYPNENRKASFINSIAFLRMILGDLHYYDGEYDSAIIEYMEAVQSLREVATNEPLRPDILVLMTRNFLKLGLAFERKKAFDSALVTYGRIAAVIGEIGQRFLQRQSGAEDADPATKLQIDPTVVESMRLIYQPTLARLQLLEKATLGGISSKDVKRVQEDFDRILGKRQKVERFLAVSEFHNKVGDILYFKNGPRPETSAVYCQSRGALCFENRAYGELLQRRRKLPCVACSHYHEALKSLCRNYLDLRDLPRRPGEILVRVLAQFENQAEGGGKPSRLADRPNFIRELGDVLSDLGDTFLSCSYVPAGREGSGRKEGKGIGSFGTLVRDLCLLVAPGFEPDGGKGDGSESRSEVLMRMVEGIRRENEDPGKTKLQEALCHYAVAAILFRQAANNRSASIQLIKILWLIREALAVAADAGGYRIPKGSLWSLGQLAISELHRSHEGTHRLEIEKLKEILEPGFVKRSCTLESVDLSRLSLNANITEVLVLIREIQQFLDVSRRAWKLVDLCSPYGMFHSVYSRIHALRLRSRIHLRNLRSCNLHHALEGFLPNNSEKKLLAGVHASSVRSALRRLGRLSSEIVESSDPEWSCKEPSDLQAGVALLEMMLVDATYCCHEIVRLLRIYGRSYMASNSMKAAAHRELAKWSNYLYAFTRFGVYHKDEVESCLAGESPGLGEWAEICLSDLQTRLEEALGPADMVHISPNYHREMALRHWKAALETHSEGRAYQELLEDMHYLNDDFADYLEHFCAGLERFRINSGLVDERIHEANEALAKTSIYDPRQYFPRSLAESGRWRSSEAERSATSAPGTR